MKTFVGGTAIKRIILKDIKSYRILLPSLSEQKQITSILMNIDGQIQQLENHLKNLKILKKSILNSKLTPKGKKNVSN